MGVPAKYATEKEKIEAKREAQRKHREKRLQALKDQGLMQTNFILDQETREFLDDLKEEIGASNLSDVLRFVLKGLKNSLETDEEFHRSYIESARKTTH